MKHLILPGALLASALSASLANATYIDDNYIGKDTNWGYDASPLGLDYSNQDRVGSNYYEVYGGSIDLEGSILTVMIDTNFYENLRRNKYFGDLFISLDGLSGPADTTTDYGVEVPDDGVSKSGVHGGSPGEIWELAFDTDAGELLMLSNAEIIQGTFKQGQEVLVDRDANDDNSVSVVGNNNSSFEELGEYGNGFAGTNVLKYTIDLSFLNEDLYVGDIGIHWTMYCANDVFEASVAEPGTFALLGLGLAGLGISRKRSKKS